MLEDIPPDVLKALGPLSLLAWGAFLGIKVWRYFHGGKDEDSDKKEGQQLDVLITNGFIQLKTDLTTAIEKQSDVSQKDCRNALTELALDLEIFDSSPARARRRRKRKR